jgi:hypothetical protein
MDDILIETYPPTPPHGPGPGIKTTHLPSGIYEISLGARSRHANKAIALARLRRALALYDGVAK